MKEMRVNSEYYNIAVDDSRGFLYLTLLDSAGPKQIDRNIVNNILAFCMQMPKHFNFIVDLRYFDPRLKPEWFQHNMDRLGHRMSEMVAGPQAHILSEIFWEKLYYDYPETEGQYPVIIEDENTGELIGRFDTIEEGETWLESL